MARDMSKLKRKKAAPKEDEDFLMSEEELDAELGTEMAEPGSDRSGGGEMPNLADLSDEDLLAEVKARGLTLDDEDMEEDQEDEDQGERVIEDEDLELS